MDDFLIKQISSMNYKTKKAVAQNVLLLLGVAFETLSKDCDEMKDEISSWRDGRKFALGILHEGPEICLTKDDGVIKYLGKGVQDAELVIYFKNIDSALLVFLGVMGAHTAAIQHRTIIHGNLGHSVQVVRAMGIVQKYLFPDFVLKKTFKRPPKMGFKENFQKAKVYAAVGPGMLMNAKK